MPASVFSNTTGEPVTATTSAITAPKAGSYSVAQAVAQREDSITCQGDEENKGTQTKEEEENVEGLLIISEAFAPIASMFVVVKGNIISCYTHVSYQ